MAEGEIHTLVGLETKLVLQDAQYQYGRGHDGRLRVFGGVETRIWALGYDSGQGDAEDAVYLLQNWFDGSGEGFQPGCGHANPLDSMAWKRQRGSASRAIAITWKEYSRFGMFSERRAASRLVHEPSTPLSRESTEA